MEGVNPSHTPTGLGRSPRDAPVLPCCLHLRVEASAVECPRVGTPLCDGG